MPRGKTGSDRILKSIISFLPEKITESKGIKDYEIINGIILCADISGFTAMTEQLTAVGREGSEEITRIINSFFKPIVNIINDCGGDIFYFGGDAIIAVFDKENYEYAIRAAEDAAKFVKKEGNVSTTHGKFNIGIHIAMACGKIFFKDTGRNFILSGNVSFKVIKLLDHAGPLEIITDKSIVNMMNAKRFEDMGKGIFKYKIRRSAPAMKPIAVKHGRKKDVDKEISRLGKYLPEWLRRRIELKQTFDQKDGEHRKAAVLFLHFRDIPFDKDPEMASEITGMITGYINILSEQYGGWVNKIDFYKKGIRALVIFGFPTKLENDERHAVIFANELLNSFELAELNISIGINSGLMYGTPVGSDIRREYTVMGDTVNTAARIAAKARSRVITVGENVFKRTQMHFKYKKLSAMKYKGKEKKISNYELIEAKDIQTGRGEITKWLSESKEIIGHKEEIKNFRKAITGVKKGKARIMALSGEAGLGKSRLVKELAMIAGKGGFSVHTGNCLSYGKTLSYYPWIELLNSLFGINSNDDIAGKKSKIMAYMKNMGKDMAIWVPVIGEVLGIDFPMNDIVKNLDSKIKKQKFFDIVLDILKYSAGIKPVCIVIEDVHWMDSISLELLNYVTRNITATSTLFLFAYRPIAQKTEFMDKEYFSEYVLKELSEEETLELVENLLNIKQLPNDLKSLVIKKSQGNPFYVEEIVKSLIEQGFITEEKKTWKFTGNIKEVVLPDSVEGVILSRIDRLDLMERDIIQTASVIGREFDEDLLKGIYRDAQLIDESVSQLENLDLIRKQEDGRASYFFKHILTCEAAYNTLSFARKREIHEKIGAYIEKTRKKSLEENLGILSHHYFLAQNYDKSLYYSVKAGDKAKNVYANEEAIEFYTRAIESYEKSEENAGK